MFSNVMLYYCMISFSRRLSLMCNFELAIIISPSQYLYQEIHNQKRVSCQMLMPMNMFKHNISLVTRVLYESRVENSGGFSSIGKFFRSDAIVSFLISKYFLIQINQILAYHRNSFCFEISRM